MHCIENLAEVIRSRARFSEPDDKILARFTDKVEVLESGCWQWTATVNKPYGKNLHNLPYGRFWVAGKHWVAHRWLWEQINGPVPKGYVLDHYLANHGECIGAQCVNPDHLEPVTFAENIRRGNGACARNARRQRCSKGHGYDMRDRRGYRACSICTKEARRRAWARQQAKKAGASKKAHMTALAEDFAVVTQKTSDLAQRMGSLAQAFELPVEDRTLGQILDDMDAKLDSMIGALAE